jgi:CRISPR-associated protein Csd2
VLVFKHEGTDSNQEQKAQQAKLGCAPSHSLFDRLQIESFEDTPAEDGKPPRKFKDYTSRITFDGKPLDDFIKPGDSKDLGNGVTLIRRI